MKRIAFLLAVLISTFSMVAQTNNHSSKVAKNLDVFNAIYKNLDLLYVDTLDANEVVGYGINSMLHSLDPYTEYYTKEKNDELNTTLTGKYAGIGALIKYNNQLKNVVIDQAYANTPAAEAGLKKGDIILSIDDKPMAGKDNSYVSNSLRGEPGTSFKLKVKRPSTSKVLTFKITRRSIQLPSVPYYGMQPGNIGYIKYTSFTEGSAKHIKTTEEPLDTVMPIVVLVDGNSASASEITSGSLQDLDRAVILGTRTFGKGLVQQVINLPYGGLMKLTTGKYYIPSGRCIQAIRYKHNNGGRMEHVPDSLTKTFYTRLGRAVKDGGGITPDVEVKADSVPNIAFYLAGVRDSNEVMFNYEVDYIAKHPTISSPEKFVISDADYQIFKDKVIKSGFKYDGETSKYLENIIRLAKFEGYYNDAKPQLEALKEKLQHNVAHDLEYNKAFISNLLANDIVQAYYFQEGGIVHSLQQDKQWKKAVELLNNPKEYKDLLKKK